MLFYNSLSLSPFILSLSLTLKTLSSSFIVGPRPHLIAGQEKEEKKKRGESEIKRKKRKEKRGGA